MPSCTSAIFVAGSLCLTGSVVAIGISFFAPYWLSNIGSIGDEGRVTDPQYSTYLTNGTSKDYPERGLWAQCGETCQWFWENDYQLQKRLLTPLSKTTIRLRVIYN